KRKLAFHKSTIATSSAANSANNNNDDRRSSQIMSMDSDVEDNNQSAADDSFYMTPYEEDGFNNNGTLANSHSQVATVTKSVSQPSPSARPKPYMTKKPMSVKGAKRDPKGLPLAMSMPPSIDQ